MSPIKKVCLPLCILAVEGFFASFTKCDDNVTIFHSYTDSPLVTPSSLLSVSVTGMCESVSVLCTLQ